MACISLPTAALIAGGLGAAGGVASAFIGGNAAQSAANTQAQAAERAQQTTLQMFNTVQQNLKPFQQAGLAAIPGVENLLGLGPQGTAGILTQLENTPGYQFALKQGLQATQNGYAAQGLGQSGAAMKGAANYAEGLAENTYSTVFQNFLSTLNTGANAATALGQFTGQASGQLSSLIGQQGAATAAGTVGAANALTGGINSALGGLSNSALLLGLQSTGMFGSSPGAGALYGVNPALYGGVGANGVVGGF